MTPDTILAQIAALQSQVTLLTESHAEREARELLEEAAQQQRDAEALAARRHASEPTKQRVLAAAKARAASAAAIDKAGDALVQALQTLRDEGQQIAADAQAVIVARHAGVALASHAGQALPHAHGVSSQFAAALADIVKRAVAAIGSDAMQELVVVNGFTTTKNCTFAKASTAAVEQLEARL